MNSTTSALGTSITGLDTAPEAMPSSSAATPGAPSRAHDRVALELPRAPPADAAVWAEGGARRVDTAYARAAGRHPRAGRTGPHAFAPCAARRLPHRAVAVEHDLRIGAAIR